jgi:hypothetical protein
MSIEELDEWLESDEPAERGMKRVAGLSLDASGNTTSSDGCMKRRAFEEDEGRTRLPNKPPPGWAEP